MAPVLFWFEQRGQDLITALASRLDPNHHAVDHRHNPILQRRLDQLWHAFGPRRRLIQRSDYVSVYLLISKALGIMGRHTTIHGRLTCARDLGAARDVGMARTQFRDCILQVVEQCAAGTTVRDYCHFLDVLSSRILCPAPLSYLSLAQIRKPVAILRLDRQPKLRRMSSAPALGCRAGAVQIEALCESPRILAMSTAPTKSVPTREFAVPWMMAANSTKQKPGFRGWARSTRAAPNRDDRRPKTAFKRCASIIGPVDLIGVRTMPIRVDAVALKQRSAPVHHRSMSAALRSLPSCFSADFFLHSYPVKFSM